MNETWRFIDSLTLDPATNMAIDEALLLLHSQGKTPPTLRFYGWNPATLSIGYFQKVEKEVDFEALKRYGLGFVRRATGGRAVLHDQELTYSFVVAESHPLMPRSVTEAYRVISEGLLHGFKALGLDAYFSMPNEEQKARLKDAKSAVCFDTPSWYELVVEGKKVAGSAQTRQKGVVLQHGSILLDLDEDKLFDVCKFSSERVKNRLKEDFSSKAIAINQLLAHPVTMNEVKKAFRQGFEQGFKVKLEDGELTKEEKELVAELVEKKYSRDEWNLLR
ncbi:lipoate--protein ligase family protein [Caldalkalibacillus mannanilyticus]|uniref:lipoate--protein ligase family protein n=1 Tax=Caldalkalibacillus mannanilyticus TaxID=1418 RepID=UPI00046986BC|nr:biotin/lipoate A/B protein ligase family protein [Caldalkalibacillus mannanilyticus]